MPLYRINSEFKFKVVYNKLKTKIIQIYFIMFFVSI
jgi:hypothetical protein